MLFESGFWFFKSRVLVVCRSGKFSEKTIPGPGSS